MTASLACQCHVLPIENGRILPFTETSWTKFVECTSKWRVLDAEKEKEVAELAHHVISNYSKSNVDLHVGYTVHELVWHWQAWAITETATGGRFFIFCVHGMNASR